MSATASPATSPEPRQHAGATAEQVVRRFGDRVVLERLRTRPEVTDGAWL